MRPSTVDLLSIRDGEPVDAELRAAVDTEPELREALAGLIETRRALRALPALEPPAGVFERVSRRLDAEREQPNAGRWRWPLRGAIAASVAIAAIWLVGRVHEAPDTNRAAPATIVGVTESTEQVRPLLGTPSYASLIAESARLERVLDGISYRPRVMRASTAATIGGLEDRIAWIDEQLMFARTLDIGAADRQALLRHRVDLMNALVQLRYTEAQRFVLEAHLGE